MLSAKRLILISRPVFYLTSLAIYCGGFIYGNETLSPFVLIGVLFVTFPMGLIVYGINDIADIESDTNNPRKGTIDGAVLKKSEVRPLMCAITSVATVSFAVFVLTQQYHATIAVVAIYALAYVYSTPPLRLKNRPLLDSLSNGAWAVAIFCLGFWTADTDSTLVFPPLFLVAAIGLSMAAVHALAAVADFDIDRYAGERTISTALGKAPTALLCMMLFLLSFMLTITHNVAIGVYLATCATICAACTRWHSPAAIRNAIKCIVFLLPVAVIAAGSL